MGRTVDQPAENTTPSRGASPVARAFATVGQESITLVHRLNWKRLLSIVLIFVAIYSILPFIAQFRAIWVSLKAASWQWVFLAAAAYVFVWPGYAINQLGAVAETVPFRPMLLMQSATPFANLVTPSNLGAYALTIRLLTKFGVAAGAAVAAAAVAGAGASIVKIGAAVIGASDSSYTIHLGFNDPTLLWAIVAVGLLAGVVWFTPQLHRRVVPAVVDGTKAIVAIAHKPSRLAMLVGGAVLAVLAYAAALYLCLRAFDHDAGIASCVLATSGASLLVSAVPVPGGLGVTEAAISDILISSGVPEPAAIAATLTYRLVTFWLPPLVGYFSLRRLRKQGTI